MHEQHATQDPVIILGSGPVGLTAAVYTGKPEVIRAGRRANGSRLTFTAEVKNYPGFPCSDVTNSMGGSRTVA